MTTPADQNDALLDLCRAFLQDPKIVSQPAWRKLVLIGSVTDATTTLFGYSYNAAGEGVLTAPSTGLSGEARDPPRDDDADQSDRPRLARLHAPDLERG